MFLFLLKRKADYNECDAMLIRAKNEEQARAMANSNAAKEGKVWGNSSPTECIAIFREGNPEILLASNVGA